MTYWTSKTIFKVLCDTQTVWKVTSWLIYRWFLDYTIKIVFRICHKIVLYILYVILKAEDKYFRDSFVNATSYSSFLK